MHIIVLLASSELGFHGLAVFIPLPVINHVDVVFSVHFCPRSRVKKRTLDFQKREISLTVGKAFYEFLGMNIMKGGLLVLLALFNASSMCNSSYLKFEKSAVL